MRRRDPTPPPIRAPVMVRGSGLVIGTERAGRPNDRRGGMRHEISRHSPVHRGTGPEDARSAGPAISPATGAAAGCRRRGRRAAGGRLAGVRPWPVGLRGTAGCRQGDEVSVSGCSRRQPDDIVRPRPSASRCRPRRRLPCRHPRPPARHGRHCGRSGRACSSFRWRPVGDRREQPRPAGQLRRVALLPVDGWPAAVRPVLVLLVVARLVALPHGSRAVGPGAGWGLRR